jgi:hypothetical protein
LQLLAAGVLFCFVASLFAARWSGLFVLRSGFVALLFGACWSGSVLLRLFFSFVAVRSLLVRLGSASFVLDL